MHTKVLDEFEQTLPNRASIVSNLRKERQRKFAKNVTLAVISLIATVVTFFQGVFICLPVFLLLGALYFATEALLVKQLIVSSDAFDLRQSYTAEDLLT